jgi:hypothetical protein
VSEQVPGSAVPVEAILARHTARRALYVGPVLVLLFGLTRGWEGAVASALGVAVVAANFVLAGVMLSAAARVSPAMYHAAALFGFLARLALLVLTMLLVVQLVEIDRVAFGVTVVVAYLALLTWEAVAVSRRRERELDWVS